MTYGQAASLLQKCLDRHAAGLTLPPIGTYLVELAFHHGQVWTIRAIISHTASHN